MIALIFTPGQYKCLQETIKKHKDFFLKFHIALKDNLLEDIDTINSILKSAEKAGRKEALHGKNN